MRLSRGTWAELQALRTDETIGEDFVFPMSAVNAWKRIKRAARLAGISEVPVSPHFLCHSRGTHALRCGADSPPCATPSGTPRSPRSRPPAAICMLGRKSSAAITSRCELRTASMCSNHVTPALRWHNVAAPLERGDRDLFGAAFDGVDGGPTEQC